jgi:pyruvate/2-oxoglutarate dehydrogenase complex dihydrolipoamide acyltransferase (E2) component
MLKTILSVSGKPGLFKLVSSAKNMIIVESLIDNKRLPIYAKDKVVSLGDIAMYTSEGEEPLRNVLAKIKEKEAGAKSSIAPNSKPEELFAYFEEVLPAFDKERVYPTDIKKLLNWYNLLIEKDIDFSKVEEKGETPTEEAPETAADTAPGKAKTAKAPKAARPKSTAAPKASSDAKVSQRATRKKV